ncbi:hypothetical protein GE09DRAFT_1191633 [Coniochaeta sp. 2T2.1]|nr:hypothetical protein GE09DRAFT_1191633 [Coniochaeta sp. 2T2.1]
MPRDSDRKPSHRELSEGERQPPAATAAPHHYEAATQSGSSKGKDKDRASKRSLASTPSSIGSTGSHHRRGQPRKRGKGEPSQSGTSKGKGKERGSQQYTPEAVHRQYVDADSPHEAVGGMSIGPGIQNRRADVSEANADYHRRKNVSDRKSDREKAEKAVKKGLGFSRLDPYHCKEKGYDCKGEDTVEAKPCYQCRALGLQWCIYNPEG